MLKVVLSCLITILMSGCFTADVTSNMSDRQWDYHTRPFKHDEILAIAQVVVAQDSSSPVSFAFLGKDGTYIATEGGEELLQIAKIPGAEDLDIAVEYQALFASGDKFWGEITVKTKNALTDHDPMRARLEALGFKLESRSNPQYKRIVPVKGSIALPIPLPASLDLSLSKPRRISFYHPKSETAPINHKKMLLLPLAVVGDVITSPAQILGLAAFVIYIETNGLHVIR